ncbi:unnamed protein product [Bursaphelenchus xylophilus]|uniref:(pine wood nematode) hypothetical protein n=1 Tax=Bursaphelenchus xylophilus TaxID=6326 RepID=A0A1I7RMZ9_BURXY|nr:unnamed protein product [Bursaphelenchus xylophilus]CAG9125306.1 unnamed protein product [Bursaphelenchus xylophilus]
MWRVVVALTFLLSALAVPSVDSKVSHRDVAKNVVRIGDYCSGVLLSDRVVLTAAHCIGPYAHDVTIKVGNKTSRVARIFINKIFAKTRSCHDSAFIILKEPIITDQQLYLACGTQWLSNCTAFGYGRTENKPMSDEVREVGYFNVSIGRQASCFTATYSSKAKICGGDSGGPTICNADDKSVVIGVDTNFIAYEEKDPVKQCRSSWGAIITNSLGVVELVNQLEEEDKDYILSQIKTLGCEAQVV